MEKIGIGIISYAHPHAPRYAASIMAHPDAQLVGVAGSGLNDDLARKDAERYGVPYYGDYRRLLSQDRLVGAYVGTEPTRHLEVVRAAAKEGRHVLCDKPIALSLEEADEIIQVARAAGIKIMVPFNPRFQLPLMRFKAALDRGEVGELVSIFAIKYGKLPSSIPGPADYGWLMDPEQAGGGGFLDIGIHAVDALRWLADSEAIRVYAQIDQALHPNLEVDDIGTMTVEFENGVMGALSAGWVNPASFPAWLDVRFEILTTEASFLIDSPYHGYWHYGRERAQRVYWWRKDVDGLVDEFAKSILEDREPLISGEDARAALAIALAAYESSGSGKVVILH